MPDSGTDSAGEVPTDSANGGNTVSFTSRSSVGKCVVNGSFCGLGQEASVYKPVAEVVDGAGVAKMKAFRMIGRLVVGERIATSVNEFLMPLGSSWHARCRPASAGIVALARRG